MSKKHIFVVMSGPSGVGKSSLIRRLLKEKSNFKKTISYTTRPAREGEVDGVDYYFVSRDRFRELIKKNFFLEYAEVYKEFYGTSLESVHELWDQGYSLIKDLDLQGACSLKQAFPKEAITIFILPPSLDELKNRFLSRGASLSAEQERALRARQEIEKSSTYDHQIVNDDFEASWLQLEKIIENL